MIWNAKVISWGGGEGATCSKCMLRGHRQLLGAKQCTATSEASPVFQSQQYKPKDSIRAQKGRGELTENTEDAWGRHSTR
ncbi:hypothetical protein B0H10DRAFT_1984732 [Mycena sp. CBHHK59/15]|nr:hypothetical protein B0H10DRAFT_1984732 [Mycena sp. CBHHK59/15]